MRRVVAAVSVIAVVLALSLAACDQSSPSAPKGTGGTGTPGVPAMPAPRPPEAGAPAGQATGATGAATTQAATMPAGDQYTSMADFLKFTDAQRADLATAVAARAQVLHDWETTGQPQLQVLFTKRQEAKASDDSATADALTKQFKELNAQHSEKVAKADAAIMAILTPEQVKAWDLHRLYEGLVGYFSRAQLTDAQKAAVQASVDKVAADYVAADEKGRTAIRARVQAQVQKEVLTDEQRQEMMQAPAMGGRRGPGGRGPGGGGGGRGPAAAPPQP